MRSLLAARASPCVAWRAISSLQDHDCEQNVNHVADTIETRTQKSNRSRKKQNLFWNWTTLLEPIWKTSAQNSEREASSLTCEITTSILILVTKARGKRSTRYEGKAWDSFVEDIHKYFPESFFFFIFPLCNSVLLRIIIVPGERRFVTFCSYQF